MPALTTSATLTPTAGTMKKASCLWSTNGSDLRIRTSNNMEIEVHKVTLQIASEIFESMIFQACDEASRHRFSDTSSKVIRDHPFISVEEDSASMCELLQYIYPVANSPILALHKLESILDLAYKYKVKVAIQILKRQLVRGTWMTLRPLSVYSIALRHGMHDVMKEIYPQLLSLDITPEKTLKGLTEEETKLPVTDLLLIAKTKVKLYDLLSPKISEVSDRIPQNNWQCRYGCWTRNFSTAVLEHVRKKPSTPVDILLFALDDQRSESECTCLKNSLDACASINKCIIESTQGISLPLKEHPNPIYTVVDPHVFRYPDADLTIRSSDSTEFRVFKDILGNASPVFSDMFLIGDRHAPMSSSNIDTSVVELTETGKIIDALLRYIYPTVRPEFLSFSEALDVMEAAVKYDVKSAVSVMSNDLIVTGLIDEDPLMAYLFASKHNLASLKHSAFGGLIMKDLPNHSNFFQHPKFTDFEPADLQRIMRCRSEFVTGAIQTIANAIRAHHACIPRSKQGEGLMGLVWLQSTLIQAVRSGCSFLKLETVLSTMSSEFGPFHILPVLQCLAKIRARLVDFEADFRRRLQTESANT
ncbi:hypothetical protein SISSUDRAFT_1051768 [Sistotremastrum suecicum HHB10207 ss-3]|uniref:BTB domain-containing protein n=1 Tax=Sistotremastrum suecicum HHB10207 ss-3 TaxID=1314776 RepID=A0A166AC07_9AGAM|nr:hypothetical protein SISSUDRAFT_1051768 [Sistotremastrum suecicum HHB10207 ss-3]